MTAKPGITVEWEDKGLKQLFVDLAKLGDLKAAIGYQGSKGTQRMGDTTVATVAAINEYGSKNIPARPFMRNAVKQSENALSAVAAMEFGQVVESGADPKRALEEVAKVIEDGIKTQLDTSPGWAQPNAPSTVKMKGTGFPPLEAGKDRLRKNLSTVVTSMKRGG